MNGNRVLPAIRCYEGSSLSTQGRSTSSFGGRNSNLQRPSANSAGVGASSKVAVPKQCPSQATGCFKTVTCMYRVINPVRHLGWVDLNFNPVFHNVACLLCPFYQFSNCPRQIGQSVEQPNLSQPNPVPDRMYNPVQNICFPYNNKPAVACLLPEILGCLEGVS